jgi:O-antigen ligase
MNDYNLNIISRKLNGFLVICAMIGIFVAHFLFTLPFLTSVGAIGFVLIIAFFLDQPLYGFLVIIILRASMDFLSSRFTLSISDNIHLNVASIFAVVLIVLSSLLIFVRRKDLLHAPLVLSFGLFIIFSGASYIYSIDKAATIQETLRIMSIFVSFVTAYVLCLSGARARKVIVHTILFAAAIPLSFALFQLITNTGFSDNLGTEGRLNGTFAHPNSFASFLLIIIAIITYRIFSKNTDTVNKNTSIILFIITCTLLILTFSRGGWFALVIFFGILSLLRAPRLLFGIAIVSIVLFFTSQTVHDRIEDIYNPPADSSIRWRTQQWKNALAAWQLSPTFGYGAGTEIAIHEQEQGFYAGNPYTHNDLVKALQETGIVGASLFVLLLITVLVRLLITYHTLPKSNDKLFVLIILLLFIAEIGFSMSSNIWRGTAVQWLLWTLIACALSLHTKKITS